MPLRAVFNSSIDASSPGELHRCPARDGDDSAGAVRAHLDFDIDAGPLLAECTLEFADELEEDVSYTVRGRVTSVMRKTGRTRGVFDLTTCVFELFAPGEADKPSRCDQLLCAARTGDQ